MTTEKNRQALMGMLPKKKEGFAGEFCECSARCDGECGCGADWTDVRYHNFVIDSCANTLCDRVVGVQEIKAAVFDKFYTFDIINHGTGEMGVMMNSRLRDKIITALSEKYIFLRRKKR